MTPHGPPRSGRDADPRADVDLDVVAGGSGTNNVVVEGTQNITHHYHGAAATRGAAAVVEQVAALGAAASTAFVGRDTEVARLLPLLEPGGSGPTTTVVTAVAGMGGVGKTALARHVAQIAAGRGWFPGGAVWVNLHGYDRDPAGRIAPRQAFAPLLRALGASGGQVPVDHGEQAAVYHQLLATLAAAGRPVLLVLDNASTPDQVADLLPRHAAHRVVVTSRHTLGDLDGARVLDLDVLDTARAVDLVDRALREREPADGRAAADREPTAALAEACGRLPLALRIAAALLADDPRMTVAELAGELADTATRLDTLAYGRSTVAAAFDLSWLHLTERDPAAARLFRLLPTNPGPDLSTEAAAALVDLPVARVRPLLRTLRQAHLVEPGAAAGRWTMHDLVRAYAAGLPEPDGGERAAATRRLLAWYSLTSAAARHHLTALPGTPVPDAFPGRDDALAWFDAERANLLPAVDLAAATGDDLATGWLANSLLPYLSWRVYRDDEVAVTTAALDAAQRLGDPGLEANAWDNLGVVLRQVRRFDEAAAALERARDLYQRVEDRDGVGSALDNLGTVLQELDRPDKAIAAHQRAVRTFRDTRDRHREGSARINLGGALRRAGRFDEAVRAHRRAIDIFRELGDRHGEGAARTNLGLTFLDADRLGEAVDALERAARMLRETGDRHGEAFASNNLGPALRRAGRFDEAGAALESAVDTFRELGDRHGEGAAWTNLALAWMDMGEYDRAIAAGERALAAYTEVATAEGAEQARAVLRAIEEAAAGRPTPGGDPQP